MCLCMYVKERERKSYIVRMKYCLLHLWVTEEEKLLVLEVAVVVLEFVDDVVSELTVESN